mgnify:CR=1 FL=1
MYSLIELGNNLKYSKLVPHVKLKKQQLGY